MIVGFGFQMSLCGGEVIIIGLQCRKDFGVPTWAGRLCNALVVCGLFDLYLSLPQFDVSIVLCAVDFFNSLFRFHYSETVKCEYNSK